MAIEKNDSKIYTAAEIRRYLNREMSAQEMHALEKAALDDPFLADAIDGYAVYADAKPETATADLQELKSRLDARTGDVQAIIPAQGFRWWRVAAAVVLLAGMGAITYTLFDVHQQSKTTLARNDSVSKTSSAQDSGFRAEPVNPAVTQKNNMAAPKPAASPLQKEKDAGSSSSVLHSQRSNTPDEKREEITAASPLKAETVEQPASMLSKASGARRMLPVNNFSGKVTDKTNKPVSNASVLVLNTQLLVETDTGGYFNFTLPDSTAYVALNAPGFENASATLRASETENHILLLDEKVRVINQAAAMNTSKKTGIASDTTASAAAAQPVTGWAAFNRYIETSKRLPADQRTHGEVVLSFTVSVNGRPENIAVDKPVNQVLDNEAVRLLTEGPAWNGRKDKAVKATVSIRL